MAACDTTGPAGRRETAKATVVTTRLVLVTGATGYVGGALVPRIIEAGFRVRVLVRDPARLRGRAWPDLVEVAWAT